ncbi:MAG: hypothetical protein IKA73_03900 [Alphaproteobacteria bacterium]|nr:hypothetical protein [Alphaproteobacteria bacterium]
MNYTIVNTIVNTNIFTSVITVVMAVVWSCVLWWFLGTFYQLGTELDLIFVFNHIKLAYI